ncbi:MAG: hypothetical protein ACT4OM_09275 [Actinomycetota bacterium]
MLTHTHAGVKALKDRLSQIGVPRGKVLVDTIAGFALRYAVSFPGRSGLNTPEPTDNAEWSAVYEGARRIFDGQVGQRVLKESFDGLYVDEYQDCTRSQHQLILSVANSLPCRVVLDPLQGIFGFAGQLVSVAEDLAPTFERLPDLTTPWRWRGRNEELGEWLVSVRHDIEANHDVGLLDAPVERGGVRLQDQIITCHRLARREGSVVAIGRWPRDCHHIAQRLGGTFTCMEPIECPDLILWARRLELASGFARAAELVDFAATCMTKVGTALRTASQKLRANSIPLSRGNPQVRSAVAALIEVVFTDDMRAVGAAMSAIERIPGRILFRRELWRDMQRTIRTLDPNLYPTLALAAWHVRDRGRHAGRSVERRTVSRTTLIKGLEFDHAVILDVARHDPMNLYVALTRASSTLTVLSAGSALAPRMEGVA